MVGRDRPNGVNGQNSTPFLPIAGHYPSPKSPCKNRDFGFYKKNSYYGPVCSARAGAAPEASEYDSRALTPRGLKCRGVSLQAPECHCRLT
jgi:hypothetical protein